jgi:hypothetical protein
MTYRSNSELYDITNIVAERLDLLISGDGWIRTTKSPEEIVHEFSLAVLPFGEAFELHPMGKLWDGT